jgi:aminoglycoside phosphotransferase (APT) family kinase protein
MYEAEVYRQLLQPLPVTKPTFYGAHRDAITGETWLILGYFDGCIRVEDSPDPAVLKAAARWLGRFHKANQALRSAALLPFLSRHSAEYYLGWADRTSLFADHLHQRFQWLATLCQRFEEVVVTLLEPPAIVIHGEYYPNNILFYKGKIYPIDWESTAVAIGEIDLTSLTEGWPPEFVSGANAEYRSARWPERPPPDFERKLEAARLYWLFRWLGDRPERTTHENELNRFEQLGILGERLGLI